MPRSFRSLAVLLLVLLLLPAAVRAAEPRRDAGSLRGGSAVLASWDVLARLWSFLTSSPGDNGCEADPSGGHCMPHQSAAAGSDNGCEVDPNGRCHG